MGPFDSKKMLIADFSFAFLGGIIYLLLFNFLIEKLFVPQGLILFQTGANFVYGIYGLTIFLKNKTTYPFLRFLIVMNSLYAAFCALTAVKLFVDGYFAASLILFLEALIIAGLVFCERKTWRPGHNE